MQEHQLYVPGLPTKRENPCVDPEQSNIPHITKVILVTDDDNGKQKVHSPTYIPNTKYYPEYAYIIEMFMKEHKIPLYKGAK